MRMHILKCLNEVLLNATYTYRFMSWKFIFYNFFFFSVPQTTMFPQQTYPTTTLNYGMNPAPVTQYPFGPPPPQYGQLPPQYGQPPPIPGPSAYSAPFSAPTAPPTYSSMFNDNPPPGQKY